MSEQPTHGNTVASVGTCPVCGRVDVPLTERGECANEVACLRAYTRTHPIGKAGLP